ncbi:MAG: 16S rRNA (cytosine(1402)-N(4))-methyltransferase RsmH [Acidobacteriota bacterium]|nr:16S rRNA (cytosine(1402)-N(4))-methyltransferase RsmH [Acidobacteriota bacterium]
MAAPLGGRGAPHRPVLLQETIDFLAPERGGLYVDCTVGLGGHSEAILEASIKTRVIGIDRDPEALSLTSERLARYGQRFQAVHADFRNVDRVLKDLGEREPVGMLADLGVSSLQFDSPTRGFSFRSDAPLDMRMDPQSSEETAADLLLSQPEKEIARIIFEYGEERNSRRIAKWIVESREQGKPITTTKELADLVARAAGERKRWHIHPATRTFQALRIAVNRELEGLGRFVETAVDLLQPDGRFVVISFHSLEDRIMKQELRRLAGYCQCQTRSAGRRSTRSQPRTNVCTCGTRRAVEILTKRPVTPGAIEIDVNPRSRSAKLRACRKLVSI